MAVVTYPVQNNAVKRALQELARQLKALAERVSKLESALREIGRG